MRKPKPDIFSYFDFRKYLTDLLEYFRDHDPDFTFQKLVDNYGLTSRSHYLDIINGRKLTRRFIPIYLDICGLSEKEAEYFRALVFYNQSRSPDEKRKNFHTIVDLAPNLETVRLEKEVYEYFEHWYIPTLLSILDLDIKENDHHHIAEKFKPPITAVQARKALKRLEQLKFISWDTEQQKWIFHHKFFSCSDEAKAAALKSFHREMQVLGRDAYDRDFKDQTFSTLTVSVNEKIRNEIEIMITDLRKKIMEKVRENQNSDRVLQINFQSFLLSEARRKQRKEGI